MIAYIEQLTVDTVKIIQYYDNDGIVFVTVGITNSIAKYGNVVAEGICAGFCIYLAGKVKRTDCNEGNWIIELL